MSFHLISELVEFLTTQPLNQSTNQLYLIITQDGIKARKEFGLQVMRCGLRVMGCGFRIFFEPQNIEQGISNYEAWNRFQPA
jgi:hypothetical protein